MLTNIKQRETHKTILANIQLDEQFIYGLMKKDTIRGLVPGKEIDFCFREFEFTPGLAQPTVTLWVDVWDEDDSVFDEEYDKITKLQNELAEAFKNHADIMTQLSEALLPWSEGDGHPAYPDDTLIMIARDIRESEQAIRKHLQEAEEWLPVAIKKIELFLNHKQLNISSDLIRKGPNQHAINIARKIIMRLAILGIKPRKISPMADGGISIKIPRKTGEFYRFEIYNDSDVDKAVLSYENQDETHSIIKEINIDYFFNSGKDPFNSI